MRNMNEKKKQQSNHISGKEKKSERIKLKMKSNLWDWIDSLKMKRDTVTDTTVTHKNIFKK